MTGSDHETLADTQTSVAGTAAPSVWPCLTLLYHADLSRVGEYVTIPQLADGVRVRVSRLEPYFSAPGSSRARSIDDPYVSRRPVELTYVGDAVEIASAPDVAVSVDGRKLTAPLRVRLSALGRGVTLQLGRRAVVLLHLVTLDEKPPRLGLIGESDAIWAVRRDIARVAHLDVPVLIRGETGVGKELVARAVHTASARASGPLVCINMAQLLPATAASELFGHEPHAFTGAAKRHIGLFEQADGGTLFLDEVGDTPLDVQGMLLRTLEEGTIRRMGDSALTRQVDVRVLSATDADLEGEAFRDQLRFRLAGYTIQVPPLRDRREDIPRLAVHFLRRELESMGKLDRIASSAASRQPWFPLELMMRLWSHEWPGNVRELRNATRKIAIAGHDAPAIDPTVVDDLLAGAALSTSGSGRWTDSRPIPTDDAAEDTRPPDDGNKGGRSARMGVIDDAQLEEVLRSCRYSVGRAASRLGVPRSSMYYLIKQHPTLRIARDISREEYEQCFRACDGDLDRMVDALQVSKRGIALQLRELGLTRDQ